MTNQHGLSRYIPTKVKSEVRRRSKYGCVICRGMVYDYEHIDPEYNDAKEHAPEHICLLCPEHHAEVTRGRLSKAQIRIAYERIQSSEEVKPPHYSPIISGYLDIVLGNASFSAMAAQSSLIQYDDVDLLSVKYVNDDIFGGVRPSIDGALYDFQGRELIRLSDNEITLVATGVEVKFEGDTLDITDGAGQTCLKITFTPPSGIKINRLRMRYKDIICEMDETFGITVPLSSGRFAKFLVGGIDVQGGSSAISYRSDKKFWNGNDLQLIGGQGIILPHCGATLAKNAFRMLLPRLQAHLL